MTRQQATYLEESTNLLIDIYATLQQLQAKVDLIEERINTTNGLLEYVKPDGSHVSVLDLVYDTLRATLQSSTGEPFLSELLNLAVITQGQQFYTTQTGTNELYSEAFRTIGITTYTDVHAIKTDVVGLLLDVAELKNVSVSINNTLQEFLGEFNSTLRSIPIIGNVMQVVNVVPTP